MLVHLFARDSLQDRDTVFLGSTGVNGGFINHNITILEDFADGLTGFDKGCEVGTVVFVGGSGDGDNVDLAVMDVLEGGGYIEAGGATCLAGRQGSRTPKAFGGRGPQNSLKIFIGDFEGWVVAFGEFFDAGGFDVEADDEAVFGEFDGEGETDVAETDDGDFFHGQVKI
jgi:hypothetical protein